MRSSHRLLQVIVLVALGSCWPPAVSAESGQSTRVADPKQHARIGTASYPYRKKADYVLKELDLQSGDVVVDIGAGDGWWSERMAKRVGAEGVIHAAEVEKKKVDGMKKKYAKTPQIKPYLCKTGSTTLPENCCDLAFFSQSYHHLDRNGHVDYLRHLRKVVKPTGRVCVIEKYSKISSRNKAHGTHLSELISQAEQAGWIPVRYELITSTYHYIAIFVQKDLFPPEQTEKKKTSKEKKK